MRRESLESFSQIIRHGQVRSVIRIELNYIGAQILGDHSPLQRRRNSSIASTYHVIPVDAIKGPEWDGYWRHERRDRLRALPSDSPRRDLLRACAIQRLTRRRDRHGRNRGLSFNGDIGLYLIAGALWQLCRVEQTLAILWYERRHEDERPDTAGTACCSLVATMPPILLLATWRFGSGSEHFTQPSSIGIQGGLACWLVVSRLIPANRTLPPNGHWPLNDRSKAPDPCPRERTMHEDKSGHLISLVSRILTTTRECS